jgi:hypothetical protein
MSDRPQRNSWKLCKTHCGCKKCQKTLGCYIAKANKHAYNASRTKFALMCFLSGETKQHDFKVSPVPIEDDPVFTPTEEESVEKQTKENELYICGVCSEKMVKVGRKKPVIYQCGHSNCAECFNQWSSMPENLEVVPCPYCRVPIEKAIRLFTST